MLPSQGRPLWGSQLSQRESQGMLPYLPAKLQLNDALNGSTPQKEKAGTGNGSCLGGL